MSWWMELRVLVEFEKGGSARCAAPDSEDSIRGYGCAVLRTPDVGVRSFPESGGRQNCSPGCSLRNPGHTAASVRALAELDLDLLLLAVSLDDDGDLVVGLLLRHEVEQLG